jgi:flagellar assembly factor FliW
MTTSATESHPAAMLKAASSRFGEIEVAADKILTMTSAVPGFPDSRRFVLWPQKPDSPLMWLHSLDEPDLAFVVMQPAALIAGYQPPVPAPVRDELRWSPGEELEVLVILTIPHGRPREMTANLLGPIILNVTARLGKQIVLDPATYDSRWPVFPPEEKA